MENERGYREMGWKTEVLRNTREGKMKEMKAFLRISQSMLTIPRDVSLIERPPHLAQMELNSLKGLKRTRKTPKRLP